MTRSDNTTELNFTFEVNEPVITGHDEMELLVTKVILNIEQKFRALSTNRCHCYFKRSLALLRSM